MIVGVPKETSSAKGGFLLFPTSLPSFWGFSVVVETGAGDAAGYPDASYVENGAAIAAAPGESTRKLTSF